MRTGLQNSNPVVERNTEEKKNQIKYKNNKKNCTQTTRRSSWLSLKHTWDQCLPVFLPACIFSTVPWFMTSGKVLWIHNITPGGESWKTKKGFEMHSFSHIPLTSWVVFSAHINAIYCPSNTISCSASSGQWKWRLCLFLFLHLFPLRRN